MEDEMIVNLYWKRDETAIKESSIKYGNMLKSISYNILFNIEDSEECVNDTYNKAWEAIPPQKPVNLGAYLGRITRNISINRWHKNKAKKRDEGAKILLSELSDCILSLDNPEKEIEEKIIAEVISKWLYTLSEDDRKLFVKRYWYCENMSSLAMEFSVAPNKLSSKLFRLRKNLRNVFEKEGIYL